MCGICGIYNFKEGNTGVSTELVHRMMDAMTHRGPDDDGIHNDKFVSLGMRRLSIIDVATGKQPIYNERRDICVVYNGEIYNYLPLMENLKKKGHKFETKSDTEVIVHLFEEFGTESFSMLNGMFAFALWDKRKQTLYLVRDRFGIKPLNYAVINRKIIFGSEIHLLLLDPDISKEIDPEALDFYLAYYYINAPRTIFKAIRKVPSASYLMCTGGDISIKRYWQLSCEYVEEKDEEFYTGKIRELLNESVKLQLQSEVPLGVFLSGGLDSASIVAFMRKHVTGTIKTFSIGFDEKSYSELTEAESVARMFETDHHPIILKPDHVPEHIPKMMRKWGEPNGDWSFIPNNLVSQEAKKLVTVILRGDGGDEIFGGYPTYIAARLAKYMRIVPKFIRNGIIKKMVHALPVSDKRLSFDYKIKRFVEGIDLPPLQAHYFWKEIFPPSMRYDLVNQDYHINRNGMMINEDILETASELKTVNMGDTLTYLDMRIFNQGCTLPMSDIASMAESLEGRVPFLDNDLVDFAYTIPFKLKLKRMKTKYIFREAMKEMLPPEITRMKKKGFTIPAGGWIKKELKSYVTDILSQDNLRRIPFVNPGAVEPLLKDHFDGKKDNTRKITCLVSLAVWYDCFN